ncbi:MAG: isoleucine--tRNA ligase, partial [Chloroflexi bacterium]|nr:isoleucine--tRNA ligase [Chloroflexota bacterium]
GSGRAVDVLFEEDVPSYVLAWTTTPWTLPGNTALAVAPEANYAVVERAVADHPGPDTRRQARPGRERLVLAQALVEQTLQGDEYWVVATLPGSELVGLRYQPLYSPPEMGFTMMRFGGSPSARDELAPYQHPDGQPLSYRVIGGDFVSMEDGTGVVHIAPAFGEDDFEIGKAEGLFFVQHVDLKGEVQPCPAPFSGKFVKEADPLVIQELQGRGLMYRTGVITHTYPFCWRCDTPLLYYVKPSWYIRTTALKQELIDGNAQIHWYPAHIREGRFGDWLENNVDWAVSRERYWGTPLPIWQCEGCGHHQCIGSRAELMRQPGVRGYSDDLDLHRPFVDEVTFLCRHCEGAMRRAPEVLDAWFDSGAMPYAQWHYPFEQLDTFRRWYPADFICEAVDQTRGWFYTLHALATLLHGAEPELVTEGICYRHVICLGHILDARGEKMSKSRGNVVDPWSVLNLHGADALRWYLYTASPAGNPRRFSTELVGENLRRFLLTLWNTYSFFVIYANIDQYDPKATKGTPQLSELDRWIRSELNQLIEDVTTALEAYNPTDAGRRIQDFVEDLSNWYVRRSRRRFWKSGLLSGAAGQADADKLAAYETLYTCLVTLAKLLAPFTPFVAEELYQNLVRSVDQAAPESVHLCRYPDADVTAIDAELSQDTRLVMRVASLGRAARSRAGLKVRQPVQKVLVKSRYAGEEQALRRLAEQVREELNVKDVEVLATPREVSRPRVTFNAKSYGQAFGRELPSLLTEVERLDPEELELALQTSESVSVGRWQVPKAALAVEYAPREGYTVASEGGYLVALSTQVTPELAAEGLARELVHRLQTMRRSAAFEIADNIETYYEGDAAIAQVMEAHQEYIRMETLSRVLQAGTAEGAYSEEQTVEGHRVRLSVRKA